jgi:hypothetical protein
MSYKPPTPQRTFFVHLNGAQEVPPVDTPVKAEAIFHFSKGFSRVKYELRLERLCEIDIADITAAHLHRALAGANGPVVVDLYPNGPAEVVKGTIRAADLVGGLVTIAQLYQLIRDGEIYVNVHSTDHPDGLIRGQVFANL